LLPSSVISILRRLEHAGFSAYVVGGYVRDMLRGVQADDIDITTNALPEQVMQVFSGDRLIPTGLSHGTVTLLSDGTAYEITTFRVDGDYADGRHPDQVSFHATLTDDLARRDFTVNAMAYHPEEGLIDPFGGKQDLEQGILRCVGDPARRFEEDALRIARLLRFMSVLNMTPDPATAEAAHALYPRLAMVAAERKLAEWKKLLLGPAFLRTALAFPDVITQTIPALSPLVGFDQRSPYHDADIYTHTCRTVAACPYDLTLRLAALFHDVGKPATFTVDEHGIGHFYGHAPISESIAEEALAALRLDKATTRAVLPLIRQHHLELKADRRFVRRWLSRLGEDTLRRLCDLRTADAAAAKAGRPLPDHTAFLSTLDEVLARQDCLHLRDLAVNGADLAAIGVPRDHRMGRLLSELLEAVQEEQCENERTALLAWAKERMASWI